MPEKRAPWTPDRGDGSYRNPVIHADYSDPDVIRAGSDFFMVASSFHRMPGLPILHSKDMVNWRIANHVIESLDWPGYDRPAHGKGAWAPSIRSHDGFFYVYFASPDEGIFMSRTPDPFGRWPRPVCVKRTIGWIDPCPFWDDDGDAYLVNGFANSRIGFKSVLRLNRMKRDGTELLSEGRFIFDGQDDHRTIEGPKMHKRNGYYYIFAPAGGVEHGWQTVLRSKSIFGPYQDRILLHRGSTSVNGPHQGAWVESESGQSWFFHFQDKGAYGRVVHLQPMEWSFDWPRIGIDADNDGIGEPVESYRKPDVGRSYPPEEPACSDGFDSPSLGLQWQWQANPEPGWFELRPGEGGLRLFGRPFPGTERANMLDLPHILSQKFPAPEFRVEARLSLRAAEDGDGAGFIVIGADFWGLEVRKAGTGYQIRAIEGSTRWDGRANQLASEKIQKDTLIAKVPGPNLVLGLIVREAARCRLFYRIEGETDSLIGTDFAARPGLWVGSGFGIYCIAASANASSALPYADFESVSVTGT